MRIPKATNGEPLKFLAKASKAKTNTCIEWPYAKTHKGYGYVRHKSKAKHAHRLVKQFATGVEQLDKKQLAMHTCNNRKCVNHNHIKYGTAKENSEYMVNSGNSTKGVGKLTEEDVKDIRLFHKAKISNKDIARLYPITPSGVSSIVTGRNWAWLV